MKVLPSQALSVLSVNFPAIAQYLRDNVRRDEHLLSGHAKPVAAVAAAIEHIPDELVPDGIYGLRFIQTVARMNYCLASWQAESPGGRSGHILQMVELCDLADALKAMPDEAIHAATVPLPFVADPILEREIRADISSAETALARGSFKAATVLAGAVSEALLLDWIRTLSPSDYAAALAAVIAAHSTVQPQHSQQDFTRKANSPEEWKFISFINFLHAAGKLSGELRDSLNLAREFRNHIHPGLILAKQARSERSSAHAALAAMHGIIEARI